MASIKIGRDGTGPDSHPLAHFSVAQISQMPHQGAFADTAANDVHKGPDFHTVGQNRTMPNQGKRPDPAVLADSHFAIDHRERVNHRISTDLGPTVYISAFRIKYCDSIVHELVENPTAHDRMSLSQMLPRIDTQNVIWLECDDRLNLVALLLKDLRGVSQIKLALGVGRNDFLKRLPK